MKNFIEDPWTLKRLPLHRRSIQVKATCGEAYRIFVAEPDLSGIAVLDDTDLCGLIDRTEMMQKFSRPVMRDVYDSRSVTLLMDRRPLTVPMQTTIEDMSSRIEEDKPSAILKGFIVIDENQFAGVGRAIDLMRLNAEEIRYQRQQIADAHAEILRAYAAKSLYLANMGHELRTPLNAIIGFSEMIASNVLNFRPTGADQEIWQRYLKFSENTVESSKLLLHLINDMLDLSKIEAGAATLAEDDLPLDQWIMACVRLFVPRAQAGNVRLAIAEDLPALDVIGDSLKLTQILNNLISNAVKFTPPGGSVTISARVDHGLVVRVTDSGVGIPASAMDIIFEPFQQAGAHMALDSKGTGLGLPLARKLAELHGGTLDLTSIAGQGTTAILTLPPERIMQI